MDKIRIRDPGWVEIRILDPARMDKKSGSRVLNTTLHGYVVLNEKKIGNTNVKNRTARKNPKPKKQNSILCVIFLKYLRFIEQ
jgi:hypothetical protein